MLRVLSIAASASVLLVAAAHAAPLTVYNAAAPTIYCGFTATCTVVVTDTLGAFKPPPDIGSARLQSRTFAASVSAPAPLAGKLGYVYRVDLTSVSASTAANCVTALQLNFGPIAKGPYAQGSPTDVFVVTGGGLGSVGLASATQTGGVVTFTFAGGGVCPGQTSYFFGLASATTTPVMATATLSYSLGGAPGTVAVRVP